MTASPPAAEPIARIAQFVARSAAGRGGTGSGPGPDSSLPSFDELALQAFAFQFARLPAYRRLCEGRGLDPGTVRRWQDVPAVPTLAFRTLELATGPAAETFRSSGTTGEARSVHRHPFPELYRATVDAAFPAACLPFGRPCPMLSLVPARTDAPDSSLAFMLDHALTRWADDGGTIAFGQRGVLAPRARSWLAARQRDSRPGLVLGTSFALVQLLEALERLGLRFRLPAGSVVFDTGGTKGRTHEVGRSELLTRLETALAVPAERVVREYGMTELTSQFYTRALAGGDPDLFLPSPWTRVRVLDPVSLDEQPRLPRSTSQ